MTETPLDLTEGRWGLFRATYGGRLSPDLAQIVKVTAKRVVMKTTSNYERYSNRAAIFATFAEREPAEKLKQSLAGVEGEMNRRIQSARDAAKQQADALIRKATA